MYKFVILLVVVMAASAAWADFFDQKWPQINHFMQAGATNLISGGIETGTVGRIVQTGSNTWKIYFPVAGIVTNEIHFVQSNDYLNVDGGYLSLNGDPTGTSRIVTLYETNLTGKGFVRSTYFPAESWAWYPGGGFDLRLKGYSTGFKIRNYADTDYQDLQCKNLTVFGTQGIVNVTVLNVATNHITLNNGWSGSPLLNAWVGVERGSEPEARIFWDESLDRWKFGTTNLFYDLTQIFTDASAYTNWQSTNNWHARIVQIEGRTNVYEAAAVTAQASSNTALAVSNVVAAIQGNTNTYQRGYDTALAVSNEVDTVQARTNAWEAAAVTAQASSNTALAVSNVVATIQGNTNTYQRGYDAALAVSNLATGTSNTLASFTSTAMTNGGTYTNAYLYKSGTNAAAGNVLVTHDEVETMFDERGVSTWYGTTNVHPAGVAGWGSFENDMPAHWTNDYTISGTPGTYFVGIRVYTNRIDTTKVYNINEVRHDVYTYASVNGQGYYYSRFAYVQVSNATKVVTNFIGTLGSPQYSTTATNHDESVITVATNVSITLGTTNYWATPRYFVRTSAGAPMTFRVLGGTNTPTHINLPAVVGNGGSTALSLTNVWGTGTRFFGSDDGNSYGWRSEVDPIASAFPTGTWNIAITNIIVSGATNNTFVRSNAVGYLAINTNVGSGSSSSAPLSPWTNHVNGAGFKLTNAILEYVSMTGTNLPTVDTNNLVGCVVWTNSTSGGSSSSSASATNVFKANKNFVNQTLTGSVNTKLTFTNRVSGSTDYDAANSKYVASSSGYYIFAVAVQPDGSAEYVRTGQIRFYTNGVKTSGFFLSAGLDGPAAQDRGATLVSYPIYLNINDYVEVYEYQYSADSVGGNITNTWFGGWKLP